MALTVVGINHRGASLEIRERMAYRTSEVAAALTGLSERCGAREAVLLSTCNRTEIYLVEDDADGVPARLVGAVGATRRRTRLDSATFVATRKRRRICSASRAVSTRWCWAKRRFMARCATRGSSAALTPGPMLNRLFQTSLRVAGRVRNETSVSRGAASVSSAAVQLAKQIFGSLAGKRAMVLGAGEMAELALECLADQGVRTSIVANRTLRARGRGCRAAMGRVAMHYDECWAALADVDVLVCSTAAPRTMVFVEHVRPALGARGDRPLCILDIAMPRDVDPAVGELENVFLYNLDDLQAVVSANLERRRAELPTAEELIAREVEKYWDWVAGLGGRSGLDGDARAHGRGARARSSPRRCVGCSTSRRPNAPLSKNFQGNS